MLTESSGHPSFYNLQPDTVLNLAEKWLGRDFSNLLRPLNSYINRVFELEDREGNGIIVKFYRPSRWSRETVEDEHQFLFELNELEIPVIAPLTLVNGDSLADLEGCHFAFFPKCGGRVVDEMNEDQLEELGRLVGRVHACGAAREAKKRLEMTPFESTAQQLDYLKVNTLVPAQIQMRFFALADELITGIAPLFETAKIQRIHGDLHLANIIYRPGESFYLIDFDDMVTGPQVQDIWMLLPDYGDKSRYELECFFEGYETFHSFDRTSYRLIEPLRAMRYIHYLAWCGHQVVEDGSTQIIPDFTTVSFWQRETEELADQLIRIRESLESEM